MSGALIAFEGIDQAGKLTQARAVQERVHGLGLECALRHYPDYGTPIGRLIESALNQGLALDPRARTMLFAANRWEQDEEMRALIAQGALVLVDRYSWSNIVYGMSQGYDETWLVNLERGLLEADLTILVDLSPQESRRRKASGRDRFERDDELLVQVRRNYLRVAERQNWVVINGEAPAESITSQVLESIHKRLSAQLPELLRLRA